MATVKPNLASSPSSRSRPSAEKRACQSRSGSNFALASAPLIERVKNLPADARFSST